MKIGVNFFGPKYKLYSDFDGTLSYLKEAGFTFVEICVTFAEFQPPEGSNFKLPVEMEGGIWKLDVAAEQLSRVRAQDLDVLSCHMMLGFQMTPEMILDVIPTALKFGRENNIRYFVLSPMKGLSVIKTLTPAIKQLSDALAEAGMTLVLHNHETECRPEEGTTALDYLMEQCPNLALELDVGWAKFAGANAVEIMKKYRDRIPMLHFKDLTADACEANRNTCFTPVGEGSIPLREIMAEAPNCALIEQGLIIDQDDSPNDILADLALGVKNIRAAAN